MFQTKGPAREKCRPAVDVLVLGTVKGHHCLLIELKLGNVITRIGGKTWELWENWVHGLPQPQPRNTPGYSTAFY